MTPQEWFSQFAQDFASDLMGFVTSMLPALFPIVAILMGVGIVIGLFRYIRNL